MHGIVARAFVLEEALAVLHVPFGEALAVFLVLLVRIPDGVAVVDREGGAAILLVAFVLVVAHDDQRVEIAVGERLRHALDGVARDVLPGDEVRRRHQMRHLRVGLLQQLAVGDRAAVLVAVLDVLVGLDEALQRLVGGEQHRRMRGAEPEHDLGHGCSFLLSASRCSCASTRARAACPAGPSAPPSPRPCRPRRRAARSRRRARAGARARRRAASRLSRPAPWRRASGGAAP